jgi:hypothetical protein
MSFLDNLESSLKNLETREERDPNEGRKRMDERTRALSTAPWAQKLKSSDYTKVLLDSAAAEGHKIRTKVYMAWFESSLRLEARQHTLLLKPTPDGVVAEYEDREGKQVVEPVDLQGSPESLLKHWFASIPEPPPAVPFEEENENE